MRLLSRSAVLALALASGALPAAFGPAPATDSSPGAFAYSTRVTSGSLVAVTISNYGFLGNNFVDRTSSLEYPAGSGYEHLPRGGLWIGAQAVDGTGPFTGVTTACLDGTLGGSPASGSEFTPAASGFIARSRLPGPDYDPAAVSDEDLITTYDDLTPKSASPEFHRPLGVSVRQVVHSWQGHGLDDILFLRFVIRNEGNALHDVWVGLDTELASGDKDLYSTWPPTSAGSPVGGWFSKAWLAYDATSRLLREHYCYAQPIPSGCVLSRVPAWIGVKLLGIHPGSIGDPGIHPTLAAWNYGPGDPARATDVQRYALMSAGTIQDVTSPAYLPGIGDPIELFTVGPFAEILPGDSVEVAFALVGGAEVADIQGHAANAQAAFDAAFPTTAVGEAPPTGLALYGLRPNPTAGAGLSVAFALPATGAAKLECFDLAGRLVRSIELGTLGPGPHVARIPRSGLRAGTWFLRLTQGTHSVAKRAVVLE